ncbi:capsular polysaccharide synthesis protein [Rhodohalobacter sp.]|uniref:capsular polysaccharide synthesis protein n=1 Tax=Rhodohalobacter sp. TaxID=1974210 RepID=UPI002ACDD509|nr:capsular polysaccharide synthesis protein [Rhodohalobacter sp.]MDZ7755182.1 capsular polysaccharide synthesis protein [Rhodohalobacter sp.]
MTKTIWTYWHQGFDQAPEIIQHCIASWKKHHPEWEIHLLDQDSVWDHLDRLDLSGDVQKKLGLAHTSDLIRTKLLVKHGGVWADPTCFCVQPLDEWLPDYMDAGVFMFHRPGRDRIISNWFIAANPDDPLLEKIYSALCAYWNSYHFVNLGRKEKSKTEQWLNRIINRNLSWPRIWFSPLMTRLLRLFPYMVYHFKVYDLIRTDKECAAIYQTMNKYPADIPHKMQRFGLLKPLTDEARQWVDEQRSPLYKLTWKLDSPTIPKDSVLYYLIDSQA